MTKEVMVRIVGQHAGDAVNDEKLASAAPGVYYERDGAQYILFEEKAEGFEETIKNRIKLKDNCLEISKQGPLNSHMVFQEGMLHNSAYVTPYGRFLMGVRTKRFALEEREESLQIQVDYELEMDDQFVADSKIDIFVISAGQVRMTSRE
ncbi:MAG: DUF1934 domain-containing protein [Lachnospiraceae bacterium]|nr:DUF1934 domain-containing protein [Lachnospiraceae bacterium]